MRGKTKKAAERDGVVEEAVRDDQLVMGQIEHDRLQVIERGQRPWIVRIGATLPDAVRGKVVIDASSSVL